MTSRRTMPIDRFAMVAGLKSTRFLHSIKGRKKVVDLVKMGAGTEVVINSKAHRFLAERVLALEGAMMYVLAQTKNKAEKHQVPRRLLFFPRDHNLTTQYRAKYASVGGRLLSISGLEAYFCTENGTIIKSIIPRIEEVSPWCGHRLFSADSVEKYATTWLKAGHKVARK